MLLMNISLSVFIFGPAESSIVFIFQISSTFHLRHSKFSFKVYVHLECVQHLNVIKLIVTFGLDLENICYTITVCYLTYSLSQIVY